MTDEQKQLIAKASNSIKAAQILFNEEIYITQIKITDNKFLW